MTGMREPVVLGNGAVLSVLNGSLQSEAVRIAVAAFLEGRGLTGNWRLEILEARVVPVEEG